MNSKLVCSLNFFVNEPEIDANLQLHLILALVDAHLTVIAFDDADRGGSAAADDVDDDAAADGEIVNQSVDKFYQSH